MAVSNPICHNCYKRRLTLIKGTVVCPLCDCTGHWPMKNHVYKPQKEG